MNSGNSPDRGIFIADTATVTGDVTLGERVNIWFGAVVRADRDTITIGKGSNIQDNAVVHTTPDRPVIIGENVSVGHGAIVHGARIHDHVLIGMGAIVMNDAEIGSDSIVGAGAVVTEGTVIPPRSVVLGVPGRVIREATEAQIASVRKNAIDYMGLSERYQHD